MSENQDYSVLSVPKGCRAKIRSDRSTVFLHDFQPPPKTQFLIARSVPRPEAAPAPVVSVSGVERERLEAAQKYRADHLLAMRERAKGLTAESGFNAESIACWEDGIDDLISEVARHL